MDTNLLLMTLFLDSAGVLMGLGAVALTIIAFIAMRRLTEKPKEAKSLRNIGLNKMMGMAAALASVIIVMAWTSPYSMHQLGIGNMDDLQDGMIQEQEPWKMEKVELPKEKIDPPKLVSLLVKPTEKPEPTTEPAKTSPEGTTTGEGTNPATTTGPISPPELKPAPPRIEEPVVDFLDIAEQMPLFPSKACDIKKSSEEELRRCADAALLSYVSKAVHYPAMAREQGMEGTVWVRFVVEIDGTISNIEVIKDATPGGGLANAAKKAIESMVHNKIIWTAGKQRGREVRVRLVVPIKFKIGR